MYFVERPTALAPGDGVQIGRKKDGVRHTFCPRLRRAAPSCSFLMAFAGR
jgi:hypothetical protein